MHTRSLKAFGVFAAILVAPVVRAGTCDSLQAAHWVLGEWVSREGDKTFTERWKQLSATTFEGEGVTTKGSNPTPVDGETLRLVQMGNGVFYVSKVAHNKLPVAFELTLCEPQRLVFENEGHDFPKRLEYAVTGADTMKVSVTDGKEKGFTLDFRRVR